MNNSNLLESYIKLLVVDDSWVVRKILRVALSHRDDVKIVGEAANGIEALEMILKLQPDVILLDMEMPMMDGMTTLQHLMILTPTPTIMLSSLSKTGTARSFDALKYGAVDFVSKDKFFQSVDSAAHSKLVFDKVFDASQIAVKAIDPMSQAPAAGGGRKGKEKVVFCEDCGARHLLRNLNQKIKSTKCIQCGDEISLVSNTRYLRMNYVTIVGSGKSGYANLLQIIPSLTREMGGALCLMILDKPHYIESFVEYLDAISDLDVVMGHNGTTLRGGCCYVFSGAEQVQFSPYSGNYTVHMEPNTSQGGSECIDTLMSSASAILKNRVAGVLLSGSEADGQKGLEAIMQKNGTCMILNPEYCLQKNMTSKALAHYNLQGDFDETGLAIKIQESHFSNKKNILTA